MTKHRIVAPALAGLVLASLCAFPAPVAADACVASGVATPPACGFACPAGNSPIVAAATGDATLVRGEARCPTMTATCTGTAFCVDWNLPETRTGQGSCAAWSESDATVTCAAGAHGAAALALSLGGCRADLYALLDLAFVASVGIDVDHSGGRDSFVWSPAGGCVKVLPGCSDFGYTGGDKGLFCGIGPGFAWMYTLP